MTEVVGVSLNMALGGMGTVFAIVVRKGGVATEVGVPFMKAVDGRMGVATLVGVPLMMMVVEAVGVATLGQVRVEPVVVVFILNT
jgi:hypothetical protein